MSIIEIPHPLGGLPREIIQERARAAIDGITGGLTLAGETGKVAETRKVVVKPEHETIKISGRSGTEALRAMNRLFYENKWTDGFPVVPPTREALEWMLTGTDREPDEIVAVVPPGQGKATVKNIAINAVMAGAQPCYLPVIITAIEAITDPGFSAGWGVAGMQACTGPVSPLFIINGPVADQVGIESGAGCFSRGHQANATIGRAVRLILTNAGRAYIGINDMKCQGSSQEYTFCAAEREQHEVFHRSKNPWQPLHVERGFPATSSTLTTGVASPPIGVEDGEHCGPEILNAVVDSMTTLGQVPYSLDWEYALVLSSTHARCLADAGLSKQDIGEFIYANAVMPWGKYKQQYPGIEGVQPSWMAHTADDSTSIHIIGSPRNIVVIVAGGECPYSQVIRIGRKSVTKEIKLPANWAELLKSEKR